MKTFKSNDNEQAENQMLIDNERDENQMLNSYLDEIDDNIILNQVFDQQEPKYPVYFERVIHDRYDSYNAYWPPYAVYDIHLIKVIRDAYSQVSKITTRYALDYNHRHCYKPMDTEHLSQLLEELDNAGIAYKIQDEQDNVDRINFVTTYEEYLIDEQHVKEAQRKAEDNGKEKSAYLQLASKPHESANYCDYLSTEIIEKIISFL